MVWLGRELLWIRDREFSISDELEDELESERSEVGGEDEDGRPELREETNARRKVSTSRDADDFLFLARGLVEDGDSQLEEQSIP